METFTYFVPIDFTERCYNALQYTTTLARSSGASVKLCHVVDPEEIPESDNPVVVSFAIDRLLQEAEKKMKSLREIILMEGISVKHDIVLGNIQLELIKQIESVRPSVVVIGGDSSKRLTSHSLLTYLTRNTASPVLVVPQSYNSKMSSSAILTLDMDFKKSGRFSALSNTIKKIFGSFSGLETQSLQFANGTEALHWIETMRAKGSVNPNFLSRKNEDDRIEPIIDFIQANKIDLLCITEKRNIFRKFFSQTISTQLPKQVEVPLLVITI